MLWLRNMSHDRYTNNSDDAKPEKRIGDDLDTVEKVDPATVETIRRRVIDPEASYIDNVSLMIKQEVENSRQPERDNFETDDEYQEALKLWEAHIARLLNEAAMLHGRMLGIEDLAREIEAFRRIVDENRH